MTHIGTDPQHHACADGSFPVTGISSHLTASPHFVTFFFTFLYVFEVSQLLRVSKPATWPVSQLTFPHENCRMSNLAVGLFALCIPVCHLIRSKHSYVVFLCFSSFPDLFHLSCPSKILSVNQKSEGGFFSTNSYVFIEFFSLKIPKEQLWVFFPQPLK